jgi:hypothetical protein
MDRYIIFPNSGWVDQISLMSKELRTILICSGKQVRSQTIKLFSFTGGYTIPALRLARVEIVNRKKIKVLSVPCKHGFPRSDIQVRISYADYSRI